MSRLKILLAALVAFAMNVQAAQHIFHKGLCDFDFCECTEAIHPAWVIVLCTANNTEMNIGNLDLPSTTMELVIRDADSVTFNPGTFNSVKDMRRISIVRSKSIIFRPLSAVDLNVLNLSLEVEHCNTLTFDKKSFNNLKGPLSVTVNNCERVQVAGETFSWLLRFKVSNLRFLALESGSFALDATATKVGRHGFGLTIEIINATIPDIPRGTFASSAGRLYFENVKISYIRSGGFSANTYNLFEAINTDIHMIEGDAFSETSFIEFLTLNGCSIKFMNPTALSSGIEKLSVNNTRFVNVDSGAVNTTVASVTIMSCKFHNFAQKAFEFSSWNLLKMENNTFDEMPPNSIAAYGVNGHKLIFKHNEIETVNPESLSFIGNAVHNGEVEYENNYYGTSCSCDNKRWLGETLKIPEGYQYEDQSHCTLNDFFSRCFKVPDQNVLYNIFTKEVCHKKATLHCQSYITSPDGDTIEFKNPRFPHQVLDDDSELSDRNKKVIGIVIVSCFGCIIIALLFSLLRWWRRRSRNGQCTMKTMLISSNTICGSLCSRLCSCGSNVGIANARSISQMSVHEYTERHRLNESRTQDLIQESSFRDDVIVPTEDKFTQTLPEELTKELLDKLKERLDSPENYVEAREMIEHLYELTKITEAGPPISVTENRSPEENIYELPYQEQVRIGRNKKKMVSVGTRTPSLDKLLPLSPYYRQTALSHEYFEPKDLAVHLYAEIANDKEKKTMLGSIPDVIAEQAIPRGPYLQAKLQHSSSNSSPEKTSSSRGTDSPRMTSTIKSNSSSSSGKMLNRPLPEKPSLDPGEGTSFKHG